MAPPFDVCIRGAGVVGRTLALLLARDRLRVALVAPGEPAASGNDVRAYALNPASRALLESLRGWPDGAHVTPVTGMRVHGDEGGQVGFDAASQSVDALAWIVDVPALEARLDEAVRFQPLIERVDAPHSAALSAVCEGRLSASRDGWGVEYATVRYLQHAIAARIECATPHGGVARQWFGTEGIVALLPTGGTAGRSAALVWSVPEASLAELMACSAGSFAERLCAAAGGAAPDAFALASERASWPLHRATADRWCGAMPVAASAPPAPAARSAKAPAAASWVLVGDAAHSVHPLAGQGLNLGLADACALARVLQARDYWRSVADLRLLRRYQRERKIDALALSWATDGLQQMFMHPAAPLQALRNWGMVGFDRSGPLKRWVARQAMGNGGSAAPPGRPPV